MVRIASQISEYKLAPENAFAAVAMGLLRLGIMEVINHFDFINITSCYGENVRLDDTFRSISVLGHFSFWTEIAKIDRYTVDFCYFGPKIEMSQYRWRPIATHRRRRFLQEISTILFTYISVILVQKLQKSMDL